MLTDNIVAMNKRHDDAMDLAWLGQLEKTAGDAATANRHLAATLNQIPLSSTRAEVNVLTRDFASRLIVSAESFELFAAHCRLRASAIRAERG